MRTHQHAEPETIPAATSAELAWSGVHSELRNTGSSHGTDGNDWANELPVCSGASVASRSIRFHKTERPWVRHSGQGWLVSGRRQSAVLRNSVWPEVVNRDRTRKIESDKNSVDAKSRLSPHFLASAVGVAVRCHAASSRLAVWSFESSRRSGDWQSLLSQQFRPGDPG